MQAGSSHNRLAIFISLKLHGGAVLAGVPAEHGPQKAVGLAEGGGAQAGQPGLLGAGKGSFGGRPTGVAGGEVGLSDVKKKPHDAGWPPGVAAGWHLTG
jgi:hypothetical protein